MKIGEQDVRHVANLAELAVDDADVVLLAAQLAGIVEFVAQLEAIRDGEDAGGVVVGPGRLMLRDDTIAPIPLARTPAQMAPVFQQGFFVVPRLGGMAEE